MDKLQSQFTTLTSSLSPPPPPPTSSDRHLSTLLRSSLPSLGASLLFGSLAGGVIGFVSLRRPKIGMMFGSGVAGGVFYGRVNEEVKRFWKQ